MVHKIYLLILCVMTCLFVSFAFISGAQAGDKQPDFPEPFIIRLPPFTRVILKVKRETELTKEEAADPLRLIWSPELLAAEYLRGRRDFSIEYKWEGGKTSRYYNIAGTPFYSQTLKYLDDIQSGGVAGPDFSHSDIEQVSWIRPENYVSEQKIEGRSCYYFQSGHVLSVDKDGSKEATVRAQVEKKYRDQGVTDSKVLEGLVLAELTTSNSHAEAWLDAETLLPVKCKNGVYTYEYTIQRAPGAVIEPVGIYKDHILRHFNGSLPK